MCAHYLLIIHGVHGCTWMCLGSVARSMRALLVSLLSPRRWVGTSDLGGIKLCALAIEDLSYMAPGSQCPTLIHKTARRQFNYLEALVDTPRWL